MSEWISVEERLPEVKAWVNVLVDRETGDYWDRQGKPRYDVYGAQLRYLGIDGCPAWQRWQMSDGGPMGDRDLHMVTHWQPLPAPPREDAQ